MFRNALAPMLMLSFALSAPAFASDETPAATAGATVAVVAKPGQIIRDTNGRRIGVVDSVRGDQVVVITPTKMLRVPAATVSAAASGLQTSLKLSQIR